jgi:two-component system OmpR family response regulator
VAVDVLLVEDDALLMETTERFLSAHGLTVATCDSPFGIGTAIAERKPRLVVLDLMMPALGGDAIVDRAEELGLEGDKLLIYSALDERRVRSVAEKLPGTRYLIKGAGFYELLATVRDLLGHSDD